MRVLLTSRGSSGHITPLAPVAHAALRSGHEVLAVVQDVHEANARRLGLPVATVPSAPAEAWRPLLASFGEQDMDTANVVMVRDYFGRLDTEAALPALRRIVEDWRPDVLVRESWELASTIAGELHGIPVARVGLGIGAVEELGDDVLPAALDPIRVGAGLPADPGGRVLRDAPWLTTVPEALEDPARPGPLRAHRFRHDAPDEAPTLPREWWPRRSDAPLVLLSFGSVAGGAHLPYFPALYRAAVDALADLDARVLLTTGHEPDPDALGPLPANVHVERWVPQEAALARAAVAVHHGGHGSTLGALAHGVPAVVVPLFSIDQWENAAAVARSGAGLALDADRATRRVLALPAAEVLAGLVPAVERVLGDPAYADAARGVAAEMAALPGPEAALDVLEGLRVAA
jgi:UDP:flavonoid glycosyltransferase YjiC (YdhE family)